MAHHDFVEFFLFDVAALFFHFLFQNVDRGQVVSFFSVTLLLSEQFYCLVKLFVLLLGFLFFKFLNFMLLLQKFALHFRHMCVVFEHFGKKVVWS
jgi:hypothetical protein